ncbi:hypothetical protein [Nonomuraea salmonea]
MRHLAPEALRSLLASPAVGGLVAGTHSGLLRLETPHGVVTRSAHRRNVTCALETGELIISGGEDGLVNAFQSAQLDAPPVTIDVGAPISDHHDAKTGKAHFPFAPT